MGVLRTGAVMTVVAALCACAPGLAHADACGSGVRTACALPGNGTINATVPGPTYAGLWYVFFARRDTQAILTIKDDENPDCFPQITCGAVAVEIEKQSQDGPLFEAASASSSPGDGGATPSATLRYTFHSEGVYYAEVDNLGAHGDPLPFTFTTFSSPQVTWPHPCIVPEVRRREHLAIAKYLLPRSSCRPGRVRRVRDPHVPRGDVVRFSSRRGTILAHDARIGIVESTG